MGRADHKLLKDKDPAKRKAGIKRVAKALDRDALMQLAIMSKDDKDADIRVLAQKAGVYIRQQLGEIPGKKPKKDAKKKDGKPDKIPVDKKDAAKAQRVLSEAMAAQIADDPARTMKALEKAMSLDPNLRHESYFVSLAESVTDAEGQSAVDMLGNDDVYSTIMEKDEQARFDKETEEHLAFIGKATWADVGFDTALLLVILTVGALIGYFLMLQGADNYQQSLDDNRAAVQSAIDEGRVVSGENGNPAAYYNAGDLNAVGQPTVTFTLIDPDPGFMDVVDRLREDVTASDVLVWGVATGVGSGVLFFFGGLLVHLLGSVILRGQGRMPHTLHSTLSFLTGRMVILLVILFVGTWITFSMGGGLALTGLMGIVGLFVLMNVLKLVTMTGQSYNFSPMQGMIAALPVVVAMGAIAYGVLSVPLNVV